jgi:hypothetical protein
MGWALRGGFANAAGAWQAAEAPVAGRDAAACRAKRDEYATLREDCPTRSAAAGSRSGGKRVGVHCSRRCTAQRAARVCDAAASRHGTQLAAAANAAKAAARRREGERIYPVYR